MKKILLVIYCLLLLTGSLFAQKGEYAAEFTYDIHRDIDYVGNGNIRQALDIYIPHNRISDKLPVIVYIHGGAFRFGSKNWSGRVMPFIKTGRYIGVAINYRLTGEAPFPALVHDCKAAIRWLKSNANMYGIDEHKIGVWGTSAGGYLAAMLATTSADGQHEGDLGYYTEKDGSVTCAIDGFGPSNILTMEKRKHKLTHFNDGDPESMLLGGGHVLDKMELAIEASPITYADKNCPPLFIYHGVKDNTVIVEQSEELYDRLMKQGAKDIYYLRIANGGHSVQHPHITQQMINFLDRYLHNNTSIKIDDAEFSLPDQAR